MAPLRKTLLLFCLATSSLCAEAKIDYELSLNNLVTKNDKKWYYIPTGEAFVHFRSVGDPNIRGQFSLQTLFSSQEALIDVYRAYAKFRLSSANIILGKEALSWGEGYYYNAGDIFFLKASQNDLFNMDTIRDNSRWTTRINVSTGFYSFWEALVAAPPFEIFHYRLANSLPPPTKGITQGSLPDPETTAVATRFLFKMGEVQTQVGYAFTIKNQYHQPYVSFQGSIGQIIDYTLASSVGIMGKKTKISDIKKEWLISAGLYYPIDVKNNFVVNLRLEAQFVPLGDWKTRSDVHPENFFASGTDPSSPTTYGAELFLESAFIIHNLYTVLIRDIYSPIDESNEAVLLLSINFFKGFNFIISQSYQYGDKTDRFGWKKTGGATLSLGVKYVF